MNRLVSRGDLFKVLGILGAVALMPPSAFAAGVGRLVLSDDQWKKRLSAAQYTVLRKAGTETPFTSPLLDEHRRGVFACAGCNLAAFDSNTKFDSHTGWPSFFRARAGTTKNIKDTSIGEVRTEVQCARCDGHLGHVFDDGPQPTGLRYCMNGVALKFEAK